MPKPAALTLYSRFVVISFLILSWLLTGALVVDAQDHKVRLVVRDGKIIEKTTTESIFKSDSGKLHNLRVSQTKRTSGAQKKTGLTANIVLNLTVEASSCGNSNGAIVVSATGGIAPYLYTLVEYSWSLNHGNFRRLSAGTYNIRVT